MIYRMRMEPFVGSAEGMARIHTTKQAKYTKEKQGDGGSARPEGRGIASRGVTESWRHGVIHAETGLEEPAG